MLIRDAEDSEDRGFIADIASKDKNLERAERSRNGLCLKYEAPVKTVIRGAFQKGYGRAPTDDEIADIFQYVFFEKIWEDAGQFGKKTLFSVVVQQTDLEKRNILDLLRPGFGNAGILLSQNTAFVIEGEEWLICDRGNQKTYSVRREPAQHAVSLHVCTRGKVRNFLYAIASRKALYEGKRKRKLEERFILDGGEIYTWQSSESFLFPRARRPERDEAHLERLADREEMEQALEALSEKEREVLELRYYEDLSYKEIAEKADMPIGRVGSIIFGAKGKLLRYFAKTNSLFSVGDLRDLKSLAAKLGNVDAQDPVSRYLQEHFSEKTRRLLDNYSESSLSESSLFPRTRRPETAGLVKKALADELNRLIQESDCLYDERRFAHTRLSGYAWLLIELVSRKPVEEYIIHLNRVLLEEAYPREIARSPRIL